MIRQRKSGGQYYYEFMTAGKRYSGTCEGCTTRREAEAYEKKQRELAADLAKIKSVDRLMERRRQEITGRAGIPLADAFDAALAKPRRRTISEKKLKQKRAIWADFVAFMAAEHPEVADLAAVTPSHAEAYIAEVRANGRFQRLVTYQQGRRTVTRPAAGAPSAATATLYQTTCTEVFKLLTRDAGLAENPFAEIVKPPKDEEAREAFTPDELKLIARNLDNFTKPLFTVALTTGMREGDICTLRWSDIDLAAGVIRRIQNKTGRGVEIPIFGTLQAFLEEEYDRSGEGEYCFPELAEMYRDNQSGVSYRVKQFLENLGIATTRTPAGRTRAVSVKDLHSCRHTFAYLAGLQGIPLAVVQGIVGHLSPEMTKHYMAHATLADKRKAVALMPQLFGDDDTVKRLGNAAEPEREEARKLIDKLPLATIREILKQYREA